MTITKNFSNTKPLDIIALRLGNHLQGKKHEVSYSAKNNGEFRCFIQTRRIKIIKTKSTKCINIIIQGTRDECKVSIEDGEWGKSTIENINPGEIIPYEGIHSKKKKIVAPIISKKAILDYISKNI